ncbi:MAG: FecR family protein [Elusimicrobiota bacterium]|jgi:hypothetical protein
MHTPLILLQLILLLPAHAALVRIGAAGAVRGKVEALAPGQKVGRVMGSGKEVYLRDAVTTGANGRMQILLLDETVFTIGPNSSLVLDEFVYDPKVGEGRMTARVTKGVFRFVTGKIARENPANMRVKLPIGVIGIRGTMVAAKIFSATKVTTLLEGPGPRNNAGERPGAMVVSAGGRDSMATRPNTAIDVTPLGPSAPYVAPPSLVAEVSGDLAPKSAEPANPGTGSGAAAASGGSTTEESGQASADSLRDLSQTESLSETGQDSSSLSDTASQDIADQTVFEQNSSGDWSASTWEALKASSLPNGHYHTLGVAQCTNGSCGALGEAHFETYVDISFQAAKITAVSFSVTWPSEETITSSLSSAIDFSAWTGEAKLSSMAGHLTNSDFDGTHIQFYTTDGQAGKSANIGLHATDSDSFEQITGQCTAGRSSELIVP